MFVDEGVCVSVIIIPNQMDAFADLFFFGTAGYWVAKILEMDPAGFKTFFQDKPSVLIFCDISLNKI